MQRIMFVCLGNICRSPMAEFIMKKLVKDKGEEEKYLIASSAVSTEELNNPMHYGAREVLTKNNIPFSSRRATLLVKSDYVKYDYFIGMDKRNVANMLYIFGGDKDKKVYSLSDFGGIVGDVPDPYWTGDFDGVYESIDKGIKSFYERIKE